MQVDEIGWLDKIGELQNRLVSKIGKLQNVSCKMQVDEIG